MLITRYLLKNLISVTAFVALTLTVVIWLTQSLKLLELVANSDAPPLIFMKLVALTLPRFLEIILPLSMVVGILFVYNKMIMDNEMIVMRSCGFNQFALARPALIMAGIMTVLLLSMTTYFSPRSYADMQVLRQDVKAEFSTFLLREGVFNTFGSDLTVYVRERNSAGDLIGLLIHDTRDTDKPPVTVTAKKGRLAMDGEVPQIIVYDGMRQQVDGSGKNITKLFFNRYTIEIKGFEDDAPTRWKEPSERTFIELLNPDMSNRRDSNFVEVFRAEAHHRAVTPFNAMTFTLVSLCCILLGPFNRRGQSRKVAIAAVLVIALEALNLSVVSAAKKHVELVPVLYALTFLPLGACLYFLTMPGEQQLMGLLRKWRTRGAQDSTAPQGSAA